MIIGTRTPTSYPCQIRPLMTSSHFILLWGRVETMHRWCTRWPSSPNRLTNLFWSQSRQFSPRSNDPRKALSKECASQRSPSIRVGIRSRLRPSPQLRSLWKSSKTRLRRIRGSVRMPATRKKCFRMRSSPYKAATLSMSSAPAPTWRSRWERRLRSIAGNFRRHRRSKACYSRSKESRLKSTDRSRMTKGEEDQPDLGQAFIF